jgi:hypothetical protein
MSRERDDLGRLATPRRWNAHDCRAGQRYARSWRANCRTPSMRIGFGARWARDSGIPPGVHRGGGRAVRLGLANSDRRTLRPVDVVVAARVAVFG